jgi:hypothetical protein
MATIEIRSRDVDIAGLFGAQHLFIIFTDNKDIKTIIRGGPEHNNMFLDNILIINSEYNKENKHLYPGDLIEGNPSTVIFTGSDVEMQNYMDQMWSKAEEINTGNYDYKLPTPGCSPSLCNIQNSNTAVRVMIEATDLKLKLPSVDRQEIWAPGIDGEFKHSIIDEGVKKINKALDVWGSFSSEEVRNLEIDNGQRFKLLSQKAKHAGNSEFAEIYRNLAAQQDMLMFIFGEIERNDQDVI